MTTDRDVFLKAIDVLEVRGWHQGGYEGADGSVCAVGAINLAFGLGSADYVCWSSRLAACELVRTLYPDPHDGSAVGVVADWNDAPERTYEDVVLALKHAAHGERVAS